MGTLWFARVYRRQLDGFSEENSVSSGFRRIRSGSETNLNGFRLSAEEREVD
ncbi:hypothetical protein GcM3_110016 [Golovinomyces cichoracearum]|uniref:Uncharacterized protein n=1 Tax=Golovinomyces cichoracearum TaxID=62708 RepID=A0A420I933_9PEZI|nr:hypothetical protein GcM3_110016 [Golovinomyces cichoracearum]